jgi:S-DNA-T family DNA segregation ATPase FtsK/SpoIIIE
MSGSSLARFRDSRRFGEAMGLLVLVLAAVTLMSLASYTVQDRTWFHHQPADVPTSNWFGRVGATWAEALLQIFGATALMLPVLLVVTGWQRMRSDGNRFEGGELIGFGVLLLFLCALLDLLYGWIGYGGEAFHAGGYLGAKLAALLRALLSGTGALLISLVALAAVIGLLARGSSRRALAIGIALARRGLDAVARWRRSREGLRPGGVAKAVVKRSSESAERRPAAAPSTAGAAKRPSIEVGSDAAEPRAAARPPAPIKPAPKPRPARTSPAQPSLPMPAGERGFSLPPVDLLNEAKEQNRESEQDLLERADQITEKLQQFSIDGAVVAIHPGPVVTTFEFKPEPGVKYSKITGMTDDLSLALRAESVRIDRLPGRSTVGIEVPNRHQETIYPRELLASERFRSSRSVLTLALGKNIHGEVHCAELERMPHLLIAGATGAGKSVGLNGMIVSMLFKATPKDLRFIMIDTKMIELGIYADIPHLLIPVVTEPKLASTALQWAVREMELRYRKLASVGLRNIAQFNALLQEEPDRTMKDPKSGEEIPLEPMPYIVIVIDEMADLMMISPADVEESVMRLAQMARAVGIHLILATQRPSVDVITGTIKANFPSRIAFRVSQRVDSRTIIDQQGAEHLLGRGDMLLLPTGSSRVVRLHSGFITEPEINRVTSFLKKMAQPVYDASVLEEPEKRGGVADGERDEMFVDAVRTVVNEGKCSITLIQRRLQLGYARAARIVDMMEQEGVVSAGEGSKPREVLVDAAFVESLETGSHPGVG